MVIFKINEKEHDKKLLRELRLIKKTKSYFEIQKVLNFYEKLLVVLSQFKPTIKVIELNEDPFIKYENFEINLISFLIFYNNFEYLLCAEYDLFESFEKSTLEHYMGLFSRYSNKKGLIIVWNDNELSSLFVEKKKIYDPLDEVYLESQDKIEPLVSLLNNLIEKKELIEKLELEIYKKEEYSIKNDLKAYLQENIKVSYEAQNLIRDIEDLDINYTLKSIINIFNDYLNNEIDQDQMKNQFLNLYNFEK